MRKRKEIVVLLTASMLTGMPGACQSENVAEDRNETEEEMKQVGIWDEEKELTGKLTIYSTFAGNISDPVMEAKFIELHPNVTINHVDYDLGLEWGTADTEEIEAQISKVATELTGGNGADIYDVNLFPSYKYMENGVFEDLYLYMNQDSDFHREDYFENVFDAMEYQGHLYAIPVSFYFPAFRFNRLVCDGLLTENEKEMNIQEIADIWEQAQTGGRLADNPILDESNFFWSLESMENAIYVDYENRTNRIGCEEERKFFENVKGMVDERWLLTQEDFGRKSFSTNDSLLHFFMVDHVTLSEPTFMDKTSTSTEPIVLKRSDGRIPFYTAENAWVINSASKNKALAWEYIKFYIGEQQYDSSNYLDYPGTAFLSVNRKNLEKVLDHITDDEATKEWVKEYAEKVNTYEIYDPQLTRYFTELLGQYYSNEITVDEFLQTYKERVDIYLKE